MAKEELLMDSNVEVGLSNPIAENFINEFEAAPFTTSRMDKQKSLELRVKE